MNQDDYLDRIFKITNFLDKARWGDKNNLDLINFCEDEKDLGPDVKLLTHWLLYVTERQTDFQRIWDIGGFVISDLVIKYTEEENANILSPNSDNPFFIPRKDYEFSKEYNKDDCNKYLFSCCKKAGNNKILKQYGFDSDHKPYFIPRYYPSDFKSFYSTLSILENYNYSLGNYIQEIFDKVNYSNDILNYGNLIPKLMFGLYLLSYKDIGRVKSSDINNFKEFIECEIEPRNKKIKNDLNNFNEEFNNFKNKKDYFDKTKRPWSAVRDFLKNKRINNYFINSLKKAGYEKYERFSIDKLGNEVLKNLELPGDVWNNNSTFKECIFPNNKYKDIVEKEMGNGRRNEYLMSEYLRALFDQYEENISEGYPEQFDITFDIVPRMCKNKFCEICPYGLLDNGDPYGILEAEGLKFKKICHGDKNKYCPVMLVSCNYMKDCVGKDNCELWKIYKSTETNS